MGADNKKRRGINRTGFLNVIRGVIVRNNVSYKYMEMKMNKFNFFIRYRMLLNKHLINLHNGSIFQSSNDALSFPSQNTSIFGSCVTRDLFELDENNFLTLKSYIARQSILSSVSPAIPCNKEDINLKSNFQKMAVYNDLAKNTFNILENDKSEYLIIDLIDERFALIQHKNTILTASPYLVDSNYFNEINYSQIEKRANGYFFNNKNIDIFLDMFCQNILKIYAPPKIILHKGYMLDKYINKKNKIKKFDINYQKNNKRVNDKINYMYDYIETKLQCGLVVNFCKKFYASENHKWGLAPMHYCTEYYQAVLYKIRDYLISKNSV